MQHINERTMRKLGVSRRELFETVERDALTALPADDWEFAEWRRARVNLDYHIEANDFLYSVPHALLRAEVNVRITARAVEISIAANASAPISAATLAASTAPTPTICPAPTGARRVDAGSVPPDGPAGSGRTPKA